MALPPSDEEAPLLSSPIVDEPTLSSAGDAPALGTAAPSPASVGTPTTGGVARVTAMTEDLIDRGAPWSARTSWTIVAIEGVVAIVLGLIFLFEPIGGSSVTLELIGIILLVGALITAFQLWRGKVRPDLGNLAAFRSGSGVTVGLVTVVATLFASSPEAVTATMAVVVGIGFLVFGLAGIAGSFIRRRADARLPLASLVINGVLAVAGLVLLFAGTAGSSSVDGVFKLLGIVLIVAGLALGGYAYLLRQQVVNGVRA
jgi:uncharacterized membrane protein HdeD (DUF308 family)